MNNELEQGCLAIIVESVVGQSVGTVVQCIRVVGEHSLYGTVWKVRSQTNLMTEYGGLGKEVDVPAKWLKKIKPGDVTNTKLTQRKIEDAIQ